MQYEESLRIETPEGVGLELPLAGLGSRFAAALIDLLLKLLLIAALAIVLVLINLVLPIGEGLAAGLLAVATLVIMLGYDIAFETLNSGRTPGKGRLGLRVLRSSGQPVGLATSAVRNVMRLIDEVITVFVAGIASILASARNQRLGDFAADTIVVRDRAPLQAAAAADTPRARAETTWDVAAVSRQEVAVAEAFLARRAGLDPEARAPLAERLADGLRPKVGGAERELPAEDFLERVVATKAARMELR